MSMSTPALVLLLVLYVFFCLFIMYFCAVADPSLSDMAYLMQIAIPNKLWNMMSNVLGAKRMGFVQALLDRALVLVYLFVVLGCWTVVFWYVYPWISESTRVSNVHKYIGYLVFVACFGSWRLANKTSPGIITAKSFKRYDHYPYDNLLFVPGRRCDTTNLIKIARSKFDRLKYDDNVPRYDHFCGWVYNTIGEENYRWFLLFLTIHVVMCLYGSTVCMLLFYGEVVEKKLFELTFFDRATGQTIKSNLFIVSQYLFARRTYEGGVMIIMFVMGIALGLFLGYHVHLTSVNQTTNESGKWADIKRWYKTEKKRYEEAVKKGLVTSGGTGTGTKKKNNNDGPKVNDGDVTCTGGTTGNDNGTQQQQQKSKEEEEEEIFDPGPMPKNLYDRGFIENWKEVLFPLSLRKNAIELSGYSKTKSTSSTSSTSSAASSSTANVGKNKSKST